MSHVLAALPAITFCTVPALLHLESYPVRRQFPLRDSDLQDGRLSRIGTAHLFEDMRVLMITEQLDPHSDNGDFRGMLRGAAFEHLAPATLEGGPIELGSGFAAVGNSSLTYAIAAFQDGRCVAVGKAVDVQVADGRPRPLDERQRAAIARSVMPAGFDMGASADREPHAQRPWTLTLNTRFSDTDKVGHMNNVAVFRYHDNATSAFIREALGLRQPDARGERFVVVRQEVSYARETHYPQPLTVQVAVTDLQQHAITLSTATVQEGARTTWATTVLAWVDGAGRLQTLPDGVVRAARSWMS